MSLFNLFKIQKGNQEVQSETVQQVNNSEISSSYNTEPAEKSDVAKVDNPETPKMKELYHKLAHLVNDTIPEEWSTVYFYGEVLSDSRTAKFFYRRSSDGKLICNHDIPKECNVDKRAYLSQLKMILDCLAELNKECAAVYKRVWTNMTLILERHGKFRIFYHYEDVLNCGFNDTERATIWQYEVLGEKPEDEKDKSMLERYLASDRFLKL